MFMVPFAKLPKETNYLLLFPKQLLNCGVHSPILIAKKVTSENSVRTIFAIVRQGGMIQYFLLISKTGTRLSIRYIIMSLILKKSAKFNSQTHCALRKAHAGQSVPVQKITGTLKIYIFLKICKYLHFTSKNNRQKEKSNFSLKFFLGHKNLFLT